MKIRLGALRRAVRESIADVVRSSGVESMWDGVPPPAVGPARLRVAEPAPASGADGYCDACFPDPCGCGGGAGADDGGGAGGVLLVVGGGGGDGDGGFDPLGADDELPIEPVGPARAPGGAPPWAVRG